MQEFLAVPRSITTPISLAALALVVFYLVHKLVLERQLLSKIDNHATASLLRKVVNWIGVIALTALLLSLTPPLLTAISLPGKNGVADISRRTEINEKLNAMLADYNQGLYDDADRVADEILSLEPNNTRALNMKGSVAFYKRRYADAVDFFEKTVKVNPSPIYTRNLADSYVETGAYQRAIEAYKSVKDGKPDWAYSIGRAHLYAGQFSDALKFMEGIPNEFNHGAARVVEAAAYMGLAKTERDTGKRADLVSKARGALTQGKNQDRSYWEGILTGSQIDIHEGHTKVRELLAGILGG